MQIYRKIWHLSFIWAPLAYYHWLDNRAAIILSLIFLIFFFLLDLLRLKWVRGNEIAYRYFSWLLREQERKSFNTAIYFSLSCLLCSLFFEKQVAVLSITLLCVGDPIAAIIGSKYGSIRILNKSLQGSLACFITCFVVSQFLFEPAIAFWAAITATFFELISSRLNDNLSIPIFTGLMVTSLLESPQLTGPMEYLLLFVKVYLIFVISTSLVGVGLKHYIVRYYFRHYPFSPQQTTGQEQPSVSVIKPVCGLDGEDFENLSSFCKQTYSGSWELIICARDSSGPVEGVVDRLKASFPEIDIALVFSERNHAVTDKMNNLIHGARFSKGQVLIFSDAPARVQPDYLSRVVAPLSDPGIGLVTGVAAWFAARTIPAALNSHLENLLGQSILYAMAYFDRLETAHGCTVALRREVYEEIGGVESVSDQISGSHSLAQAVREKGYKIHLLDRMIPLRQPSLGAGEMLARTHRMAVVYKTYYRHGYPLFLFQLGFVHALLYWCLEPGSPVGPVLVVVSVLAEIISHLRMNYLYVRDRNTYFFIWVLPILLAIAPLLWASPFFSKVVSWRGQRYFVDYSGVTTRLKNMDENHCPRAESQRPGGTAVQ